LRAAVATRDALDGRRIDLEASGGIDIGNIQAIADTGVDFISIGAMTKNVSAIDFSMRFL
jgi:nicotinate-nucleotide pyrophosphorylase (carboxylating)